MTDRRRHHILTINDGSSSRKFSLYDLGQSEASEESVFPGQMERIGLGDSLFYASNSDSKGLIEQHLQLSDHYQRSKDYINLDIASKHPMPQCLDMPSAQRHCERGAPWPLKRYVG